MYPVKSKDPQPTIYKDAGPMDRILAAYKEGETFLEVIVSAEHLSKDNRRVRSRQLWGDIIYTNDSDIVAALMHMGYFAYYLNHPPPSVYSVNVTLKLLPPLPKYNSKARFVKSRAWCSQPNSDSCSFQVEKCILTTRYGTRMELLPCVDEVPAPYPTVQPMASDRQITTRTAGAKSKVAQEVSVQYNLCNEPWLKYTLPAIADKSLKPSGWVAARLRDDVLFLETVRERYQLCYVQTIGDEGGPRKDIYSFARCKAPLPMGLLQKTGVPMPPDTVDVLEQNVEWEEFQWAVASLFLRGKEYPLKRMHFMPISRPAGDPMET